MRLGLAAIFGIIAAMPAAAEIELSFYGGAQNAPHSDVFITGDPAYPAKTFIGWEGRSFDPPPYYGWRITKWQTPTLGYGIDFAHNKI